MGHWSPTETERRGSSICWVLASSRAAMAAAIMWPGSGRSAQRLRVDTRLRPWDNDQDPCGVAVMLGHVLLQSAMSQAVQSAGHR